MARTRSMRAGYRGAVATFFLIGLALVEPTMADEPAPVPPESQAEPSLSPVTPEAVPPADPPAPEVLEAAAVPSDAPSQNQLYTLALTEWNLGHVSKALDLAREASAAGLPHDGARLLTAYALVRLSRVDDALPVFAGLALDPLATPEARRRAEKAWRQRADRRSRSGVSASLGAQIFFRPYGGEPHTAAGYSLTLGFPLAEMFGMRLDAALNDDFVDALLAGPTASALFTAEVPLGSGVFHGGLGVGPAGWFLTGPLEPDGGTRVDVGLHTAAWVDARCWRSAGFALEFGGYSWPQMAPDLVAYLLSWDARISFVAWFGPGNRRAIPAPH